MDISETRLITEDELLALGSDAYVEVINGEVVEMTPVGGLHHLIAGNIYEALRAFVSAHKLGYVFMDGLIYLLDKKDKGLRGALVPDVSYISKATIPANWQLEKPFPSAPTLAVEVMSPGDEVVKVLTKVRLYLKAGTTEVWVVYPEQAEIHQYRRATPDTVNVYTGTAQIDVTALFPDLTLIAQNLFVLPNLE